MIKLTITTESTTVARLQAYAAYYTALEVELCKANHLPPPVPFTLESAAASLVERAALEWENQERRKAKAAKRLIGKQ